MKRKGILYLVILILFFLNSAIVRAQLTAPGSSATEETNYPTSTESDNIYIFCTTDSLAEVGELHAETNLDGTKTFLWEKYNSETAGFEFYFSESSENKESSINSLGNGGYRVTITQGETTEVYQAWVFNNWYLAEGSISNSNCESFKLNGAFKTNELTYYDLSDNTAIDVYKDVKVEWNDGETAVASLLSPQIFSPPTKDTEYTLRVYDRFGCETTTDVLYESIVTKAKFSIEFEEYQKPPDDIEAPATVTFLNESENGDPNQFEWFFFRDLDDIKRESEGSDQPVDSIMVIAYDFSPVYTYENSGTYDVKLVSKHVTDSLVCVDTTYLEDYIVVDTSFIDAPNVFNPDVGSPDNEFVVKFWSMQSIKISIFNRWGKKVHFWKQDNIRGFVNTYEASVWDGRIGGRKASPGVYYYVVEGVGRDDKKRWEHGFVHLFRNN